MNPTKPQYLQAIRSQSAYPVYRSVIGLIALLGYLLAGAIALGALVAGVSSMGSSFMLGVIIIITGGLLAGIVFLSARLSQEAALMLADMADSTVDAHSRSHG